MKKKFLAVLLAACMVAAMLVPASAATTFDDVAEDAWYAGSVERWTNYGILDGMGDNKFDPEGSMTRAQFAKVIVELLGLDHESTDMPFDDVLDTNDGWAAGHIAAAYNAGIINGMGDGKFAPGNDVTFDQSAAMLARATGLVGPDAWGAEVTEKLEELGMLDENVNADAEANRALVAALADNMIGAYVTPDTIETETEDGVITGTKGVILVKGDVEVKVENATVGAIVVQGGSVTVSGETTVSAVKVGGENAAVTAEEGTKIDSVTVEGTDAKVELNGEVASVTVAKDATVAELKGEGVSKDNVTNKSANEITVNDETVDAAPAEENPDDNQGDDENQGTEITNGVVPEPTGYTVDMPAGDAEVTYTGNIKVKDENGDDTDEVVKQCGESGGAAAHTWKLTSNSAKCLSGGTGTYTCDTCGATTTVATAALGHQWVNVAANDKHTAGIGCGRGSDCDGDKEAVNGGTAYVWQVKPSPIGGSSAPVEHTHSWAAAWSKDADNHWHVCEGTGDCEYKTGNPGKVEGSNGWATHTWGTGAADGTRSCTICGQTTVCSKKNEHPTEAGEETFTCSECGYTLAAKED